MTCYEGLSKEDMNKEYADFNEEDFDGVGSNGNDEGEEEDSLVS